jgi:ABC-type uncharacterized transport system substrate-binding protein
MRNSLPIAAILAALLTGAPVAARAHPHVWVTVQTEVLYGSRHEIIGLRHKWTFDEMYTAFAVQGLDKNGDGKYSRKELQPLAEVNIATLADYGFFTFPRLGKKLLKRKKAADYWLDYANGVLTLRLTLPFVEPVSADKAKDFSFGVYDPTFYVDFSYPAKAPVRLAKGAPAGCSPKVTPPKSETTKQVSLGEAFYATLDSQSDFGAQFAPVMSIECGKG